MQTKLDIFCSPKKTPAIWSEIIKIFKKDDNRDFWPVEKHKISSQIPINSRNWGISWSLQQNAPAESKICLLYRYQRCARPRMNTQNWVTGLLTLWSFQTEINAVQGGEPREFIGSNPVILNEKEGGKIFVHRRNCPREFKKLKIFLSTRRNEFWI